MRFDHARRPMSPEVRFRRDVVAGTPPRQVYLLDLPSDENEQLEPLDDDTLFAEGIRTAKLCAAGLATGFALVAAYDPAGACALVSGAVGWWHG